METKARLYWKLENVEFIPDYDYYPSIALNVYSADNFLPADVTLLENKMVSTIRIFTQKTNKLDVEKIWFFTKDYEINIRFTLELGECDNVDEMYKTLDNAIRMYFKKNSIECKSVDTNKEVLKSFIHGMISFSKSSL